MPVRNLLANCQIKAEYQVYFLKYRLKSDFGRSLLAPLEALKMFVTPDFQTSLKIKQGLLQFPLSTESMRPLGLII